MKGLIYKEFYLNKKNYMALLAVVLGLVVLGVMVGLGTRVGNLKDYAEEDKAYFFYMFFYAIYAAVLVFVLEIFWSIENDRKSGWRKIEYTMPITARKRVGAWYLTGAIVLGCSLLIGLANAGLMAIMFKQTITVDMFKNMVIILLVVSVIPLVGMPLYQRFSAKTMENAITVLLLIILVAYLIFMAVASNICKNQEQLDAFLDKLGYKIGIFFDWFLYLSPIIIPLLIVGSFTLSVRWYQRRGK